ncbi:glycoside hydrolase family 32 protein, partial [Vibrio sp.]|uniref:glycoside hydrolase family 32 protein n=1 Tax=Vibrio sp. TaxID=678 RepID=UPI003D0D91CD
MLLESCVERCGGIENIVRVLYPGQRLVLAVADDSAVNIDSDQMQIEDVLGETQVSFPHVQVTEQQLLDLGKRIASRQKQRAADKCQPVSSVYRPMWHISPPQGLLNDPNGFIFHQGQYHLFYQWHPFACQHKDKYWAHLTSKDLVHWHWQPIALTPSDWFDAHGVFSGHAVSDGDQLKLFYTGNTRIGTERDRHTTQCIATSSDGIEFHKQGPVIAEL